MGRANNLTPPELLEYSKEHLSYEIRMLFGVLEDFPAATSGPTRMALIEGFVTHLRNLIGFLYPASVRRGDVLAEDFVPSGVWEEQKPTLSQRLVHARTRAHKEIAHLTVDRISGTPPGKEWDATLADDLMEPLKKFAELAAYDRLHPDVRALILQRAAQPLAVAVPAIRNLTTEAWTLPSTTSAARPYGP